jgi:hypothetical protein
MKGAAWSRFGSQFVDPGISLELACRLPCSRCGLMNSSVVSEVASLAMDYQSGSKQPHSKGCRRLFTEFWSPDVGPNLFAVSDTPDGSAVFRSSDQGESWTQVGADLPPGQSVSSLAAVGPKLFAAAPGGVFLSTDQGESWMADNAGLNGLGVRALAVAGEKLFAGTFGGGVFITDVKQ